MIKRSVRIISTTAMIVLFVGCSLWLKLYAGLSEASFMALVTISVVLGFLLPNIDRLKSFSLTRGEVILQEIKDSEVAIKELALATLELVEASTKGARVTEEFDQDRFKRSIERMKSLTSKREG